MSTSASAVHDFKNAIKHGLLSKAGIRRMHIVGCARSGTTMLHYSLVAFDNTILYDRETSVWNQPTLKGSFALFCRSLPTSRKRRYFITKRGADWWHDDALARLETYVRKYRIFLIHIVRDPRDVLTSKHALDKNRFYVSTKKWAKSTEAADRLLRRLDDYPAAMTLRYEDVVLRSDEIERQLGERTGLRLRRGVKSWARLKDNLSASEGMERMIPYMHELRNFDPASIGKWKRKPELTAYIRKLTEDSPISPRLAEFMNRHGYK
jgi:hypothetical protein